MEITTLKARKAAEAIRFDEENHANNNLAFKDSKVYSSPVSPVIPRKCEACTGVLEHAAQLGVGTALLRSITNQTCQGRKII